MTAKEEAYKLGNKFYQGSVFDYDKEGHLKEIKKAKERALICVDEILRILPFTDVKYWQEVKQELEKL